jgi:four helix bundle protein
MEVFSLTKTFPREEMYSLTDQIRRSSRSISGQLAEGWRKRRYEAAFVSKLVDAAGEAGETQVWLEYCVKCGYMDQLVGRKLHRAYDRIIGKLVNMENNPSPWLLLGKPDNR